MKITNEAYIQINLKKSEETRHTLNFSGLWFLKGERGRG